MYYKLIGYELVCVHGPICCSCERSFRLLINNVKTKFVLWSQIVFLKWYMKQVIIFVFAITVTVCIEIHISWALVHATDLFLSIKFSSNFLKSQMWFCKTPENLSNIFNSQQFAINVQESFSPTRRFLREKLKHFRTFSSKITILSVSSTFKNVLSNVALMFLFSSLRQLQLLWRFSLFRICDLLKLSYWPKVA